jgi:starch synthase
MQDFKNATILFEPDGYVVPGDKIMGRQAAGNSFLRSVVAHAGKNPLWCYTPSARSAQIFYQVVGDLDASVKTEWCPAHKPAGLRETGTLYLPGPNLDTYANQRLRVGVDAYSLCGVTHTTATHGAMDAIANLLTTPVMPWDALICTSTAVRSTAETILQAQTEFLSWRFGSPINPTLPQLPVIPLGIQCEDFSFSADDHAAARAKLGIADDEIVFLFVGRLSYHAKAHPHAMLLALEAVARETGKRITLLQCGWFANAGIEATFREAPAKVCPNVRCLFTDGRDTDVRGASWAASDVFISLSDNYQETFGITPIEAMAAGLPVIVSDWDGYKDTVPDGVTGFRIPTWSLADDNVHGFAARHEARFDTYDRYCGYTCQTVAVDQQALQARITDLVENEALRKRMGAAGRAHAYATYDWNIVYKQYLALWAELADIRQKAGETNLGSSTPHEAAGRMDPYKAFSSYPTAIVGPGTIVRLSAKDPVAAYRQNLGLSLFSYASSILPNEKNAELVFAALADGKATSVADLTARMNARMEGLAFALTVFAKMGLVSLSAK